METITLRTGKTVKLHSSLPPAMLEKALMLIESCENKEVRARAIKTMAKGFSVLDVSRETRVVIDTNKNYHCMTHEKYNGFIRKR